MSRPTPFTAALLLGLACAFLLGWLAWRTLPADSVPPAVASSLPAAAHAPAAPASISSPPARSPLAPLLAALRQALTRRDVRAKEALLTFKNDAALQAFLGRAAQAGVTVIARSDGLRTVRVGFDTFDSLQSELLQHAGDYETIAANPLVTIPRTPAKEDRAALDQIPFGNDTLRYLGATAERASWGRGVTIAVLDSGVTPDVTFGTGRLSTLDIGLGSTPGSGRDDGHGTSVAALAAGLSPDAAGVAPAANVLSIRVTDANGTSDLFTLSQAIVAAADAGARVINISLGGYTTGPVLDSAIAYAQQKGAVLVAAAGNDQAPQLAWPAADPRVLSVGAIDRAEQQVMFSNSSASLQLTAPGYGVQTAWLNGQRAYVDGTSASAPLVAGALAAVMSQNSQLSAPQAAALLVNTASDGGAPGADEAFGRGILNVGWAMNQGNAGYVDTAVASHFYDAATNQMQFVVQNRSGRSVTGMTLNVSVGATSSNHSVPSLAPGESYVAKVPVTDARLRTAGSITFTTQLTNPLGVVDQVPANNRRSTVLSSPGEP